MIDGIKPLASSALKGLKVVPIPLFLLAAMILTFSLISDRYLTVPNAMNVIVQTASGIGIIALASYLAICSTGVDLSLGATVSFAGMTAARVMSLDSMAYLRENNSFLLVLIAILAALAVGAMIGAINGIILSKTNIPSFIATLGTFLVAETLSRVVSGGGTIRVTDPLFAQIGGGSIISVPIGTRMIGILPYSMLIMLGIYLIFNIVMKRTRFGTNIYAMGGNYEAARLSGINVDATRFKVFVINGILAAIVGIILTSRLTAASAQNGLGLEFEGIAAAVVGGAAMAGGKSTPWSTLIGAFIIAAMRNGFNIIGVPSSWQMIFIGLVLILIVSIDATRSGGGAKS